jgi:transposase
MEFSNDADTVRKTFKKLAKRGELRVCYEAGPCGYEFWRLLQKVGISCEVIAPSLIPRRPGDKVKTDRRDACKLARYYRAGELTVIRVPSDDEEAARDLLRCREDLGEDLNRQRHRLLKFLLRHGRVFGEGDHWTQRHWTWLKAQRFEQVSAQRVYDEYLAQVDASGQRRDALDREIEQLATTEPYKASVERLKSLRGVGTLTAMILLTEIGDFRRFTTPRELMNFVGLTPGVHESAGKGHGLGITKTGNGHVRRVLVEAAWQYARKPQMPSMIARRCAGQSPEILHQAREAQLRLNSRYRHLVERGKKKPVAAIAVARELVGFVWAVMVKPAAALSLENANERAA